MRPSVPPAPATQLLERAFAMAGMIAMAGILGAAYLVGPDYGAQGISITAFLALGACAVIGLWAREAMERAQRGEMARVYAAALSGRRDARLERGGDPTRLEALGLAAADLLQTARRAMFGGNSLAASMIDGRRSIERSRQRGQTVVASMTEDAHAIASAAQGSREVERNFAACVQAVRGKAQAAETATEALAGEAETLADAIRATTVQTERATALAARLSEVAFATQSGVSGMAQTTGAMLKAAGEVHDILQRAEMIGLNAGIRASRAGEDAAALSEVAAEVKDLARSGGNALAQINSVARELKAETATMIERVEQISTVVQAQQDFGHALSHAAMLQADAVGRVLRQVAATHAEVHGLRLQVRDMPLPQARLGVTPAAQQAVERLPGYADAMAQILRGLPDFSSIEKTITEKT